MFKLFKKDDMGDAPIFLLPTTASETYVEGEALVLTSGKLTKCGATVKPTHISLKNYVAPATNNEELPVIRVQDNHVYETTNAAILTAVIGDKVTLHTDGAQVTTTTTSGVAELVAISGTAIGSKVQVRF